MAQNKPGISPLDEKCSSVKSTDKGYTNEKTKACSKNQTSQLKAKTEVKIPCMSETEVPQIESMKIITNYTKSACVHTDSRTFKKDDEYPETSSKKSKKDNKHKSSKSRKDSKHSKNKGSKHYKRLYHFKNKVTNDSIDCKLFTSVTSTDSMDIQDTNVGATKTANERNAPKRDVVDGTAMLLNGSVSEPCNMKQCVKQEVMSNQQVTKESPSTISQEESNKKNLRMRFQKIFGGTKLPNTTSSQSDFFTNNQSTDGASSINDADVVKSIETVKKDNSKINKRLNNEDIQQKNEPRQKRVLYNDTKSAKSVININLLLPTKPLNFINALGGNAMHHDASYFQEITLEDLSNNIINIWINPKNFIRIDSTDNEDSNQKRPSNEQIADLIKHIHMFESKNKNDVTPNNTENEAPRKFIVKRNDTTKKKNNSASKNSGQSTTSSSTMEARPANQKMKSNKKTLKYINKPWDYSLRSIEYSLPSKSKICEVNKNSSQFDEIIDNDNSSANTAGKTSNVKNKNRSNLPEIVVDNNVIVISDDEDEDSLKNYENIWQMTAHDNGSVIYDRVRSNSPDVIIISDDENNTESNVQAAGDRVTKRSTRKADVKDLCKPNKSVSSSQNIKPNMLNVEYNLHLSDYYYTLSEISTFEIRYYKIKKIEKNQVVEDSANVVPQPVQVNNQANHQGNNSANNPANKQVISQVNIQADNQAINEANSPTRNPGQSATRNTKISSAKSSGIIPEISSPKSPKKNSTSNRTRNPTGNPAKNKERSSTRNKPSIQAIRKASMQAIRDATIRTISSTSNQNSSPAKSHTSSQANKLTNCQEKSQSSTSQQQRKKGQIKILEDKKVNFKLFCSPVKKMRMTSNQHGILIPQSLYSQSIMQQFTEGQSRTTDTQQFSQNSVDSHTSKSENIVDKTEMNKIVANESPGTNQNRDIGTQTLNTNLNLYQQYSEASTFKNECSTLRRLLLGKSNPGISHNELGANLGVQALPRDIYLSTRESARNSQRQQVANREKSVGSIGNEIMKKVLINNKGTCKKYDNKIQTSQASVQGNVQNTDNQSDSNHVTVRKNQNVESESVGQNQNLSYGSQIPERNDNHVIRQTPLNHAATNRHNETNDIQFAGIKQPKSVYKTHPDCQQELSRQVQELCHEMISTQKLILQLNNRLQQMEQLLSLVNMHLLRRDRLMQPQSEQNNIPLQTNPNTAQNMNGIGNVNPPSYEQHVRQNMNVQVETPGNIASTMSGNNDYQNSPKILQNTSLLHMNAHTMTEERPNQSNAPIAESNLLSRSVQNDGAHAIDNASHSVRIEGAVLNQNLYTNGAHMQSNFSNPSNSQNNNLFKIEKLCKSFQVNASQEQPKYNNGAINLSICEPTNVKKIQQKPTKSGQTQELPSADRTPLRKAVKKQQQQQLTEGTIRQLQHQTDSINNHQKSREMNNWKQQQPIAVSATHAQHPITAPQGQLQSTEANISKIQQLIEANVIYPQQPITAPRQLPEANKGQLQQSEETNNYLQQPAVVNNRQHQQPIDANLMYPVQPVAVAQQLKEANKYQQESAEVSYRQHQQPISIKVIDPQQPIAAPRQLSGANQREMQQAKQTNNFLQKPAEENNRQQQQSVEVNIEQTQQLIEINRRIQEQEHIETIRRHQAQQYIEGIKRQQQQYADEYLWQLQSKANQHKIQAQQPRGVNKKRQQQSTEVNRRQQQINNEYIWQQQWQLMQQQQLQEQQLLQQQQQQQYQQQQQHQQQYQQQQQHQQQQQQQQRQQQRQQLTEVRRRKRSHQQPAACAQQSIDPNRRQQQPTDGNRSHYQVVVNGLSSEPVSSIIQNNDCIPEAFIDIESIPRQRQRRQSGVRIASRDSGYCVSPRQGLDWKTCARCGGPAKFVCSLCHKCYYCSTHCQKVLWKEHLSCCCLAVNQN